MRYVELVAEEDFSITPVEAQACITLAIAHGKGGAPGMVVANADPLGRSATDAFLFEQSADRLRQAIESIELRPRSLRHSCHANAKRFGMERFRRGLTQALFSALASLAARHA